MKQKIEGVLWFATWKIFRIANFRFKWLGSNRGIINFRKGREYYHHLGKWYVASTAMMQNLLRCNKKYVDGTKTVYPCYEIKRMFSDA